MIGNHSKWSLIPAIFWTVIALVTAFGIAWALPIVAPLPVVLLGVSVVSAFVWWSAFAQACKPK